MAERPPQHPKRLPPSDAVRPVAQRRVLLAQVTRERVAPCLRSRRGGSLRPVESLLAAATGMSSARTPMASKRTSPKKTSPQIKVTGPASYFPSIEKKYGKPIAEWKKLIRSRYPAKHMEIVSWLKAEHGMGHGHATALVGHALAEDAE
jgi:hypothetical protein